jgi:uncharacterized sulfatase
MIGIVRCGWSVIVLMLVSSLSTSLWANPPQAVGNSGSGPPNVILIIGDDQAWTDFGFMGHPDIKTPHLDRFASQSAVFERGYVPTSVCRPSLATLISGLYPHQHKITGNNPPKGTDRREMLRYIRNLVTLPDMLATKGYRSHQSGKWWEGGYQLGGFSAGMTHGEPSKGGRHGDDGLVIGRQGLEPIFEFIEACDDQPYFLWYAPFLPQLPHDPPQRLLDLYTTPDRPIKLSRYYAMCQWFDETCGQLLEHIDQIGHSDNTLVLFVVDNGWIQRTPSSELPENWPYQFTPNSKLSPYNGGIRTPIMLRWPGKIRPGRYPTLVGSIDVAPTILAAVGIEPPHPMAGMNLLDVVKAQGKTKRKALFGEIYTHDMIDIGQPAQGLLYRSCVEGRWKAILPTSVSGRPELYDLSTDPHETKNLAGKRPELVSRMTDLANRWWPGQDDRPER